MANPIKDYLDHLSTLSKRVGLFKTKTESATSIDKLMENGRKLYTDTYPMGKAKLDSMLDIISALKSIVTVSALPNYDTIFWSIVGAPGSANFNLRNEILSCISDLQVALPRQSIRKNIDNQIDKLS